MEIVFICKLIRVLLVIHMVVEKLTKNEITILKILLDNGRMSDTEISEQLHISPQAIGKIRRKLEDNDIIQGYTCMLNFEKIGLHTFALTYLNFYPKVYTDFSGVNIFDILRAKFRLLFCCVPSNSEVSLICLFGFKDMVEMDSYFKKFKAQYKDYCQIERIIPFSYNNLLSFDPRELMKLIIDRKILEPLTINQFKSMGKEKV
jgi:DNA-binding Lrp family transcriptional regulator